MTKLAFFGTSNRSTPILESLKQNFDLVLCMTKGDVLTGRHQTPKETEVKRWAKENKVNFIIIKESIKDEAKDIVKQIKLSGAELGIVADFGFIIPQKILDVFPHGLINIHFSLLPKYRGASPVQSAILNGDAETGVTYLLMELGLDTGPVIDQFVYQLNGPETAGELYKTLFKLSADRLPQVIQRYLSGNLKPRPQDIIQASYAPKICKENAQIDWNAPVKRIRAAIRAYNPWPVAWTTLGDMQKAREKVVGFTQIKDPQNVSKTAKIHSTENETAPRIAIKEIQIEGGKILTWEQFKNGYLV